MKNYMLTPMLLLAILFTAISAGAQTQNSKEVNSTTTSREDLFKQNGLTIYPTQCVNKLMIDNPDEELLSYRILNTDGKEITNGSIRPKGVSSINVSGYPSGAYYLCVSSGRTGNTYRFAKM